MVEGILAGVRTILLPRDLWPGYGTASSVVPSCFPYSQNAGILSELKPPTWLGRVQTSERQRILLVGGLLDGTRVGVLEAG